MSGGPTVIHVTPSLPGGETKATAEFGRTGILLKASERDDFPLSKARHAEAAAHLVDPTGAAQPPHDRSPMRSHRISSSDCVSGVPPAGVPDSQESNATTTQGALELIGFSFSHDFQRKYTACFGWCKRFLVDSWWSPELKCACVYWVPLFAPPSPRGAKVVVARLNTPQAPGAALGDPSHSGR